MNEEDGKKRSDGTSGAMREPPRISEEDLRACLQDQYDLSPVTLTFLPLGRDYDAGMYRVESEQGTAYALKVTSRPLYEPRCLVPRYPRVAQRDKLKQRRKKSSSRRQSVMGFSFSHPRTHLMPMRTR